MSDFGEGFVVFFSSFFSFERKIFSERSNAFKSIFKSIRFIRFADYAQKKSQLVNMCVGYVVCANIKEKLDVIIIPKSDRARASVIA